MRSLLKKSKERREVPRYPLERLAKLQLGYEDSHGYYCLITDISDGGVRLSIAGLEIPDEFILLLSGHGPAKDGRYRVVWRDGNEVGAKFVN
jgi:PilZ domain